MNFSTFSLVLLAAVLHAFWNFATKKVSGSLSVLWLGQILAVLFLAPAAVWLLFKTGLNWSALPYLLATGVIHVFYFFFLAKAYRYGDISLVYPIARGTGVVGTALAGYFLISESLSLPGVIGISSVSAGILAIGLRGTNIKDSQQAIAYSLLVGGMIALYSAVDKVAVAKINPIPYITGQAFLVALILMPYLLTRLRQETIEVWRSKKIFCLITGLGSVGTYLLILFAFQRGQASYIVAVREFAVVIGSWLGFAFLKEMVTAPKILGILLVTLGLILIKFA